jgi:predicted N-acetyltransferase YhbS
VPEGSNAPPPGPSDAPAPRPSAPAVVRPARAEDLPAALGLLDELFRLEEPWRVFPPRPGIRDEAEARYRAARTDPDSVHLVAEVGGAVVGTVYARVAAVSTHSDAPAVELANLAVAEGHRGRGVGRALVAAVGRFAASRGVERVTVKAFAGNEAGLGFWSRMGFRPRMVQLTAPVEVLAAPPTAPVEDLADPPPSGP